MSENIIVFFFPCQQLELVEPSGWIHVPLTDNHKKPTRTFMIQIAVLANHQNGRDTHMRQIKIYTPVEESSIGKFPRCTTIDFMMYRSIRWLENGTEVKKTFVLSCHCILYQVSLLEKHVIVQVYIHFKHFNLDK